MIYLGSDSFPACEIIGRENEYSTRRSNGDWEWAIIGPFLPPERWARSAGDNRLFLNGMLHVLRTDCP